VGCACVLPVCLQSCGVRLAYCCSAPEQPGAASSPPAGDEAAFRAQAAAMQRTNVRRDLRALLPNDSVAFAVPRGGAVFRPDSVIEVQIEAVHKSRGLGPGAVAGIGGCAPCLALAAAGHRLCCGICRAWRAHVAPEHGIVVAAQLPSQGHYRGWVARVTSLTGC
jgi:hypothetical protein